MGDCNEVGVLPGDRTRAQGLNLHQWRFKLDVRKNFLVDKVVQHWKNLPRKVVQTPSLKTFKRHVDVVFGMCFSGDLGSAELRVGIDDHEVFLQPKWFWNSVLF